MGCLTSSLELKLAKAQIDSVPSYGFTNIKTIGKVVDVYDGDTCKIILSIEDKLMRFNCRLKSIDSEEIKQKKSESDREVKTELAIKARNRLIQLVSNCKIDIQDKKNKKEISELLKTNTFIVEVRCGSFDKYGRLLVDLYSNSLLINDIMVLEGYAKSYDGKTKN